MTPLSEESLREKIGQILDKWGINPDPDYGLPQEVLQLILQERRAWGEYVIGVEPPCEPDCTAERHAYHQGAWDLVIEQEQRNTSGKPEEHIHTNIIIDWEYTGDGDHGYGKCGDCGEKLSGFLVTNADREQRNTSGRSD